MLSITKPAKPAVVNLAIAFALGGGIAVINKTQCAFPAHRLKGQRVAVTRLTVVVNLAETLAECLLIAIVY